MKHQKEYYIWALLRISLGFIFFWAFLDKLFGLYFTTLPEKSWLAGVSPTEGFLTHATRGPFAELFQSIAGNPVVDWLFMIGLFGIGLAMLLGIGVKIAGYSGALMSFFMWLSVLPPEFNPFLDQHIIYLFLFIIFTIVKAGHYVGFGKWWSKTKLVKRFPILE